MITHRIFTIFIICALSTAPACTHQLNANAYITGRTLYKTKKVSLIIAAIGLTSYALVKFGLWLLNPSDENATDSALQTINEVTARYANIATILNNAYAPIHDRQACIDNISEQVLYEIAKAKYHDTAISTYLERFAARLKKIDKQLHNIRERIKSAQNQDSQDYATQHLIAKMKTTEDKIQAILPSLTFAHDYLSQHKNYFLLFETEDRMLYRYERDLSALEMYQGDLSYLREMIHQSVMIYQRRHADPYPYRWYILRLEEDIQLLKIAIKKFSYNYPSRHEAAYTLCNKLETIRETLLGSPYYAQELRAYEYAKITQAAIAAQQRLVPAEENNTQSFDEISNLFGKEILPINSY